MNLRLTWKRLDRWLLSRHGIQKVRYGVLYGIGLFAFAKYVKGCFVPKSVTTTIFGVQDNYGRSIEMPEKLSDFLYEELARSEITEVPEDRAQLYMKMKNVEEVKFYLSWSLEPVSLGYLFGPLGALTNTIGIPNYLTFESPEDVRREADSLSLLPMGVRRMAGVRLSLEGQGGQELSASLLLSDVAKRFLIQREIQKLRSLNQTLEESLFAGFCGLGAFGSSVGINWIWDLHIAHRLLRVPMYAILAMFFGKLYRNFINYVQEESDLKMDKEAVAFGEEHLKGGLEYYNKVLQRNRALRQGLGASLFTEAGDFAPRRGFWAHWFRQKTSILKRIAKIKEEHERFKRDPDAFNASRIPAWGD